MSIFDIYVHICPYMSWCQLESVSADHSDKYQQFPLLALCEGNPPVTSGFPSQKGSNAGSVSVPWCHHDKEPDIHKYPQ